MKKKWEIPLVQDLDVSFTESIDPYIISMDGNNGMLPFIKWVCPCCNEVSKDSYFTSEEAYDNYGKNHRPICQFKPCRIS